MQPKVSIIISAYNYGKYLRKAIDSSLSQDYPDGFEVIVVNDASTDETDAICQSYGSKIIYLKNERNIGQAASQNRGIKAAKGDYICILDADDAFLPGAIKWYAKTLDNFPFVGVVYGDIIRVNEIKNTRNRHRSYDFDRRLFEIKNIVYCSSQMYRKDCLKAIGGYDEKIYYVEDYDIILRVTERMCGLRVPAIIQERTMKHEGMTGQVFREDSWQIWKNRALMNMKKRKLINKIRGIFGKSILAHNEQMMRRAKRRQAQSQCNFIINETSPNSVLVVENEPYLFSAFKEKSLHVASLSKDSLMEITKQKDDYDLFVLWHALEKFSEEQVKGIISEIKNKGPNQITLLVETKEFYDGAWDIPTVPCSRWVWGFAPEYEFYHPRQGRPQITMDNWFYNYGLDKVIFFRKNST